MDELQGGTNLIYKMMNLFTPLDSSTPKPSTDTPSASNPIEPSKRTQHKEIKTIDFNGLFIELKKPDASSLPFGKHDNGAFTTNDHLQEQAKTLCRLTSQGYLAVFAIGYDGFIAVDEAYFRSPSTRVYLQEQRVTFKDGSTGTFYRIRYS